MPVLGTVGMKDLERKMQLEKEGEEGITGKQRRRDRRYPPRRHRKTVQSETEKVLRSTFRLFKAHASSSVSPTLLSTTAITSISPNITLSSMSTLAASSTLTSTSTLVSTYSQHLPPSLSTTATRSRTTACPFRLWKPNNSSELETKRIRSPRSPSDFITANPAPVLPLLLTGVNPRSS
ncbi:hypothetical protein C0995_005031 [Termitomyces sp. Mi166|nr:hypothetical protein C0995_005031 [Termitomyces sp. Mi166\